MLSSPRHTLAMTLFFGLAVPSLSPASIHVKPAAPLECAESVALSATVGGATLTPDDPGTGQSNGRRLVAAMVRRLGENRIALDPEGPPLQLDILTTSDGEILIALSSRNPAFPPDAAWLELEGNALFAILPAAVVERPKLLEGATLEILDRVIASRSSSNCEPARSFSARGRYAFEIPPSHPAARARYLRARQEEGATGLESWPSGTLFALDADGEEQRLASFPLADKDLPEKFLITEDGRFVVAFGLGPDHRTTIYRADGGVVVRLAVEDLLTPREMEANLRLGDGLFNPLTAALDEDQDRLILTTLVGLEAREIAIDLESGRVATDAQ